MIHPEIVMDLHNNSIGRQVGATFTTTVDREDIQLAVLNELTDGTLYILDNLESHLDGGNGLNIPCDE